MPKRQLKMTFELNTIEHLGVRMYSTIPPVLAELISNAYDADAEKVTLTLKDEGEKEIIVEDDGIGMSFDEINEQFLKIGRNRRLSDDKGITAKGRKVIGKKGLGKLSFFGIANEAEIRTRKGGKENIFIMKWEDIQHSDAREYLPEIVKKNAPCPHDEHGTKIILRRIKKQTDFSAKQIAESISRIFIIVHDFNISVVHNNKAEIKISNDMRFKNIKKEFTWKIPEEVNINSKYDKADQIKGLIITADKPISHKTNMRGIILFSRGKLVNAPDYFSDNSTSSHFFSYLTGYLHVDFIDDMLEEVISTNRQSLIWQDEEMVKLRKHLEKVIRHIQNDWRKKIEDKKREEAEKYLKINLNKWYSSLPQKNKVKNNIKMLVLMLMASELSVDDCRKIVEKLYALVPSYPQYHWRHLHKNIKEVAKSDYQNKDYYGAVFEALKKYADMVRTKSRINNNNIGDHSLMEKVFNERNLILDVVQGIVESTGCQFPHLILKGIRSGHKSMSMGVVAGFRNPIAHGVKVNFKKSKLLTEEDCLDILSLLSHLFRRLDKAKKVK